MLDIKEKVDENYYLTFHMINKSMKKGSNKNLSSSELYNKKRISENNRINNITYEQYLFLQSIFNLQQTLGLTDLEFALKLGLKTDRVIRHWKKLGSHYPSKRVLNRILALQSEVNIIVIVISNKISIGL